MIFSVYFKKLSVFSAIIFLLFGCGGGGGGGGSSKLCLTPSTTETSTHILKSYIADESCEVFYDKLVERLGRATVGGPHRSELSTGTLYTMVALFRNNHKFTMRWGSATCVGYSRCMVDENITK